MLTGIPCCHALSAKKLFNDDPVNFSSFWFKKETYAKVYNSIIYPLNGEQVWDNKCCATSHKKDVWKTKIEEKVGGMVGNEEQESVRLNWIKEKMWICNKLGHNRKSYIEKPSEQGPSAPDPSQQGPT